jgi:hypothetical protein
MAADGGGSPHDLVVQSWIMYTIGIILYLIRLYASTPAFYIHRILVPNSE